MKLSRKILFIVIVLCTLLGVLWGIRFIITPLVQNTFFRAQSSIEAEKKVFKGESISQSGKLSSGVVSAKEPSTRALTSIVAGQIADDAVEGRHISDDALTYLDTNYLNLVNTTPFTPDADYEPSTKKYVDDVVTSVVDHGNLLGLSDDDHTIYPLLLGRNGGQTLIGGTGTTDDLSLQTTSGVGTTGADMHFLVGNNGATEALTILNNGNVGIGMDAPNYPLHLYTNGTLAKITIEEDAGTNNAELQLRRGAGDWYFRNYGNFGIYSETNNYLTIDTSGNVGIGTNAPGSNLTIQSGTGSADGVQLLGRVSDDGSNLEFRNNANNARVARIKGDNSGLGLSGQASGVINLKITTSGNVGIGTASPTIPFHVTNANNVVALLESTDALSVISFMDNATTNNQTVASGATGNDFYIVAGGSEQMRIDASGNVGIGITDPDTELEINGHLKADTFVTDETTNHTVFVGDDAGGSGTYTTMIGEHAGDGNSGDYVMGVGYAATRDNSGSYVSGISVSAAENNTGSFVTAIGVNAGQRNTGGGVTAIGANTGQYGDGDNNTAIGKDALTNFDEDTGSDVTFDFGDIDAGTDRITVTGHGLGADDSYLHLKYTEGTASVPGIYNSIKYQFKIIDVNTLELQISDITGQGTGTGHTLTPRYTYSNSVALGYNAEPDASNQIMLGNANVTQIKSIGNLYLSGSNDNYINGNVGIGVADPKFKLHVAFDETAPPIGIRAGDPNSQIIKNAYWDSGWKYVKDGYAWYIGDLASSHTLGFHVADTGIAENAISFTEALSVDLETGNVGIGTTSPAVKLDVVGDIQTTGSIISKGITWTSRTSAADNLWLSVTYGNGLFVAVASTSTGNRVMTSPDGIIWTIRTSAADNDWYDVIYGNGMFVTVASTGTGDRVMTSPDGINWTSRTSAADNGWLDVTYGNGLFVAVANSGTGNRVMTSPDGINWTSRTSAADNSWRGVTYGNGLFVAVAYSGTGNRVMTSPDGVTWTIRTSAADNGWRNVTYGNGLFVAVSNTGTNDRVMTSPDGITWTTRTSAADNQWYSVAYGNRLFVAVASTGTGDRVMTSGVPEANVISTQNIYQGGMTIHGNVGIGTTVPAYHLHITGGDTGTDANIALDNTGTDGDLWRIFSTKSTHASGGGHLQFLNADTTNLMIFTSTGRVGIGTDAPSEELQISSISPEIRLDDSDAAGSPHVLIDGSNGTLTLSADPSNVNGTSDIIFKSDNAEVARIKDNTGYFGLWTNSPDRRLDILDDTNPQLRLTHTDGSKFADFSVDTNHDLWIIPSSTGQIIQKPTTDSTDFAQVRAADETVIWNIDTVNERVGIGLDNPTKTFQMTNGSADFYINLSTTFADIGNAGGTIRLDSSLSSQIIRPRSNNVYDLGGDTQQWRDFYSVDGFFSGNVGIGTTAPGTILHIENPGELNAGPMFTLESGETGVFADEMIGRIDFVTSDASLSRNVGAYIRAIAETDYDTTDPDTRLEFGTSPTTDNLQTRMVIDSSGNVGIGTTAPATKLQVEAENTDGSGSVIILEHQDSDGIGGDGKQSGLRFDLETETEGVSHSVAYIAGYWEDATETTEDGGILFSTVENSALFTEKMRITSDGNVGIGTDSPAYKLDTQDAINPKVVVTDTTNTVQAQLGSGDSSGIIGTLSNHALQIRTNNVNAISVDTSGNVGIGTTSPDRRLDILDATNPQLRLSHTDGSKFVDFQVNTAHDLVIKPSSTGQFILQSTTDSIDFFQVFDADGGVPTLNVDTVNERVGIGTASPSAGSVLNVVGADASTTVVVSGVTKGLRIGTTASGSSIEGVDDTGTASYEPLYIGGSEVNLSISGAAKATLTSAGLLGIGITGPGAELDIASATPTIRLTDSDAPTKYAEIESDSGHLILGADQGASTPGSYVSIEIDTTEHVRVTSGGFVGIGVTVPDTQLDVDGAITARELSADPSDPDEGSHVCWQSDGVGSGDDGDIICKITAGGSTRSVVLADFSTLAP